MRTRLLLSLVAASGFGVGCKKDEAKSSETTPPTSENKSDKTATPGSAGKAPAGSGVAKLFAGSAPAKASVIVPAIELGMKHEDAEALWKADKAQFKTADFQLGFIASDDKTVDMIQYTGLPKDGVVALGDKAWGKSQLDPAASDPDYPVNRSCWFNTSEGIRACARYDEKMSWTALTIDHYLAAESMVTDGLFVFERGQSLIGKDYEGLKAQLLRFDDWPHRKNSFIPATDFEDINKLDFEFNEDGKVTAMSFSLHFVDDAHKDRLLAGLAKGLGEATVGEESFSYSALGREVVAKLQKERFTVTIK